ncbi:MAG TPA: ribosome biogenesis GTPase Der [Gammaproteobacteria bacterium]|nr:ribosome biogenesis GTPase Der [Gammaproteobacteria bacterium]
MKPVIALLGRPNVGKSTLFNRLTNSRSALVYDFPGVTRDMLYGEGDRDGRRFLVVDTAGMESGDNDPVLDLANAQQQQVLKDCSVVLFLVDARCGLLPADSLIATQLRRQEKPVFLVVNKAEGLTEASAAADFYGLGLGLPKRISALQGDGISSLLKEVLPAQAQTTEEEAIVHPVIALVGRPNVGKSTLTNMLLGESRVVVFDQPGTTRDSVCIPFEWQDQSCQLIDTAGIRRRGRINSPLEQLSVVKTMQTVDAADVVLLLLDARTGVVDQDAALAGLVERWGRAIVLVVNKWDGLTVRQRTDLRRAIDRRLPFLNYLKPRMISALHGSGVDQIMPAAMTAYESAVRDLGTGALNRHLAKAIEVRTPPLVGRRRIRLKYVHQGGKNPPRVIVHGNQLDHLPGHYLRYLSNYFTRAFGLDGTRVRLELRSNENPYAPKAAHKSLRRPSVNRGRREGKRI